MRNQDHRQHFITLSFLMGRLVQTRKTLADTTTPSVQCVGASLLHIHNVWTFTFFFWFPATQSRTKQKFFRETDFSNRPVYYRDHRLPDTVCFILFTECVRLDFPYKHLRPWTHHNNTEQNGESGKYPILWRRKLFKYVFISFTHSVLVERLCAWGCCNNTVVINELIVLWS